VSPVVGGDNKRLKANNVRKVVGSTIDYLKDLAGVQLHQFPLPDVNQVSHCPVRCGKLVLAGFPTV
jgi:hypothetical protein